MGWAGWAGGWRGGGGVGGGVGVGKRVVFTPGLAENENACI